MQKESIAKWAYIRYCFRRVSTNISASHEHFGISVAFCECEDYNEIKAWEWSD